jgi:hypothetical protein
MLVHSATRCASSKTKSVTNNKDILLAMLKQTKDKVATNAKTAAKAVADQAAAVTADKDPDADNRDKNAELYRA